MKSLPPTGYGITIVRASKADIDVETLAKVPVETDGFDGGRKKKVNGKVIVVVLVIGVIAAIMASAMSHRGWSRDRLVTTQDRRNLGGPQREHRACGA